MTRRKHTALPVIDSCDGCGVCCMEQSSPPMYLWYLRHPDDTNSGSIAEDAERVQRLPQHLKDELLAYGERLKSAPPQGEQPCLWYDRQRNACRHYEHRPSICRDALEPGDEDCRAWRQKYQVREGGS